MQEQIALIVGILFPPSLACLDGVHSAPAHDAQVIQRTSTTYPYPPKVARWLRLAMEWTARMGAHALLHCKPICAPSAHCSLSLLPLHHSRRETSTAQLSRSRPDSKITPSRLSSVMRPLIWLGNFPMALQSSCSVAPYASRLPINTRIRSRMPDLKGCARRFAASEFALPLCLPRHTSGNFAAGAKLNPSCAEPANLLPVCLQPRENVIRRARDDVSHAVIDYPMLKVDLLRTLFSLCRLGLNP